MLRGSTETSLPLRPSKDRNTELPRSQLGNQSPAGSPAVTCHLWSRFVIRTAGKEICQTLGYQHHYSQLLLLPFSLGFIGAARPCITMVHFTVLLEVLCVSSEKSGFRVIPVVILNATMKEGGGKN